MLRYVVLHHQMGASDKIRDTDSHFDWMFDRGDALWTWATDQYPELTSTGPLEAVRLADHRRAYLDYEGLVSGNRGKVSRVESGEFETIHETEDGFQFRVTGERCGIIRFQRTCAADIPERSPRWCWSFLPNRVEAS